MQAAIGDPQAGLGPQEAAVASAEAWMARLSQLLEVAGLRLQAHALHGFADVDGVGAVLTRLEAALQSLEPREEDLLQPAAGHVEAAVTAVCKAADACLARLTEIFEAALAASTYSGDALSLLLRLEALPIRCSLDVAAKREAVFQTMFTGWRGCGHWVF